VSLTERLLDPAFHTAAVWAVFGLALITIVSVVFITAPYGRHARGGWGPTIPSRVGWIIMETPPILFLLGFYLLGEQRAALVPLVLLVVWQSHYVYRGWIFPFRMRSTGKRMPLLVALLAVFFNTINAYVNGLWISHFAGYDSSWLTDPRFLVGVAVFFGGMAINHQSDNILFNLRKPGDTGYKIPEGGMYRFVSAPNYLGEIIEWIGWAIATWSLAGLAFAVYTIANLAPRAGSNHRWYREKFPDYPAERRALIPYVW
jgi:steroid 5-alpha-reductase/3-oxo-5-alpha-steroid 4-dehydrogenase 1